MCTRFSKGNIMYSTIFSNSNTGYKDLHSVPDLVIITLHTKFKISNTLCKI